MLWLQLLFDYYLDDLRDKHQTKKAASLFAHRPKKTTCTPVLEYHLAPGSLYIKHIIQYTTVIKVLKLFLDTASLLIGKVLITFTQLLYYSTILRYL